MKRTDFERLSGRQQHERMTKIIEKEFPAPTKAVDPDGNIHDICLCNCHCVGSSMMH